MSSNSLIPNNKLRPNTAGINAHDDNIASIILFNKNSASVQGNTDSNKDYLTNFSNRIESLITLSTDTGGSVGFPESAGGTIKVLELDNYGTEYFGVFNNFSVTGIQESHNQIVKVHMNFSATWNAFFLGETPKVYQFTGVFLDTQDYPYYQEFMTAYDKYLSGRKTVENNLLMKIIVSGQIIDGYLLNVNVTHNANVEALKSFTFSVLVKGSSWLRTNFIPGYVILNNLSADGRIPKELDVRISSFNGLSNLDRLAGTDIPQAQQ